MADAFGGVSLKVLPGGWQRDGPTVFSERVIPGGSGTVYIDIAGKPADRIVLPLFATQLTGLDSLRALKGTTAALTYGTGAPGGAVSVTLALLVDVRLSDTAPLGETHAEGEWKVITP
jgi:hypothetical protein